MRKTTKEGRRLVVDLVILMTIAASLIFAGTRPGSRPHVERRVCYYSDGTHDDC